MTELMLINPVGMARPAPAIFKICRGPGVAKQQTFSELVSLLRDIRAQCESKTPGKGVYTGSLVERLWRGSPEAGGLPKVSWLLEQLTLFFPGVL